MLASDKTKLSVGTGNQQAHPVYLSIGNIHSDIRNKSTNHALILLALLPIPEFKYQIPEIQAALKHRLFHFCLAKITQPLKDAAKEGVFLTDPYGCIHHCFTLLASYMVDYPEACDIACVINYTSPVSTASWEMLGSPEQQDPCLGTGTD